MHDPADLELDRAEMLAMGQWVLERVVSHIDSLNAQPASGDMDVSQRCKDLVEPAPEQGMALEALLAPLFDDWVHHSFNAAAPGYLAYVPGGGLFPSALADFIADGLNRYTGLWNAAPLLVQLEANVLDWFRDWMGFPATTRGLLTTGGSMATFGAVVSAREKLLGAHLRDGVLYTSSQAHHCVAKAAKLAGILPDRIRAIEVDDALRMRVDRLADAIDADRKLGLVPFMVVSAAGTTNTGAVDPLKAIGALCKQQRLWHHIDGAYGGFFNLCPELQSTLDGLSDADSLALDPHKGLFLPYGTGALLVRDGEALRAAHEVSASYLPPLPDSEFYNPCVYGPELSRDYRGLRVWLPLKLFGVARFRAALCEKRALALHAARHIEAIDGISLLGPPELSLFAFQFGSGDRANQATRELLERVNARQRVMLTGTQIGDQYFGRVCVLCFRTRALHIDHCIEDLAAAAAQRG